MKRIIAALLIALTVSMLMGNTDCRWEQEEATATFE